jgi:hypothetical protein
MWPDPVQGQGAYYVGGQGNRYSRPHQLTVYCADDVRVAITEGAFYQALNWQKDLASFRTKGLTYPLRSEHILWAFNIDPAPVVLNLEDPVAQQVFAFPPHVLLNPSQYYAGTQAIADDVRVYQPPTGSPHNRPEGLKAPSVRTPYRQGHQPYHYALFVVNTPGSTPFEHRSTLLAQLKIEYEFLTHKPSKSVDYADARIDWTHPKFRLSAIPGATNTWGSVGSLSLNRWYRLTIVF